MPGISSRGITGALLACAVSFGGGLAIGPPAAAATAADSGGAPFVHAVAGELINPSTGRIVWKRESSAQRPIASLTKVMVALVVVRADDLRRRIRITQAEVNYVHEFNLSNAGLIAGDVLTARSLLKAMLLPSGADAALALAESYGPGVTAFVGKMNATARKLHLRKTHFTDFTGLAASDVSTPANLVRLGSIAMSYANFRDVVDRKWFALKAARHRHHYFWRNTNLLLRRYPGTSGIKTGWTPSAGECLLFEATYHGKILIGVIMDSSPANSGETFVDAARLLNWKLGRHVPVPPPTPPPAAAGAGLAS